MNGPIAEFVTENEVTFRVIRENWSNHKNPTHPAVLERYDGEKWNEVDRWDIEKETDSVNNETMTDEEIIETAVQKINTRTMFKKDGDVVETNRR